MRVLYRVCVGGPPLSTAPDDIQIQFDWLGILAGIAFVLTPVAVLANRYLETIGPALVVAAVLVVVDWRLDRRARTRAAA